jgi:endonuclease/exonuclease/phosphatase (EEP) superfamily protein YafD
MGPVETLRWALVAFGMWLISGTALGLSHHPHWYVRGWDFPRVLIAVLALGTGVAYRALVFEGQGWEAAFLAGLGAVIAYQASRTVAFTPLARKRVKAADGGPVAATLRLAISNVLRENEDHARWLAVMTADDPDVVVAVEVDDRWMEALAPLRRSHPHVIDRRQDNYYGIAVFSRLPLRDTVVRFLVDEDMPSVRTTVELANGSAVLLYALHPKPPEPLRNQHSGPRDAELVLVAKEVAQRGDAPTIVCGDLNDVAWSDTTRTFLRVSGLLDPRVGRGLLNTFDANNPLFRFPLDHVFHSRHFKLIELRRLPKVGSDHFPVFIALALQPDAREEQAQKPPREEEERVAEEMVERGGTDAVRG